MELEDLLERAKQRKGEPLPPLAHRREIRVQAGLTQAEVAELLGVHPVSLARYEAGTRSPRGEHRARYLELLRQLSAISLETGT